MKTLILLRHGRAEPAADSDIARPLSLSGRMQIQNVSACMDAENLVPQIICTSPALRARETAELLLAAFPGKMIRRKVLPEMYQATAEDLREIVHGLPDTAGTVLFVGHNPAFEELAGILSGIPAAMGTGNCVILNFADWKDTGPGTGKNLRFIRPEN